MTQPSVRTEGYLQALRPVLHSVHPHEGLIFMRLFTTTLAALCLAVITAGHAFVCLLFHTLRVASAAAFLRFLCVDDLFARAIPLATVSLEAGSVLGEGWCAEPARASRAWHCFETPLHERWYRASERSGR